MLQTKRWKGDLKFSRFEFGARDKSGISRFLGELADSSRTGTPVRSRAQVAKNANIRVQFANCLHPAMTISN
jgi:hypothetical protein